MSILVYRFFSRVIVQQHFPYTVDVKDTHDANATDKTHVYKAIKFDELCKFSRVRRNSSTFRKRTRGSHRNVTARVTYEPTIGVESPFYGPQKMSRLQALHLPS